MCTRVSQQELILCSFTGYNVVEFKEMLEAFNTKSKTAQLPAVCLYMHHHSCFLCHKVVFRVRVF